GEGMQDKPKVINKKIKQGRPRSMKVGAINITTHPHTPEDYVRLLIAARRSNIAVPIYGKSLGTIGFLTSLKRGDPLKGVYGEFHRYFDIEIDGRWYNLEKGKQADD